jgi:SAM-dependent methyltransferase
MHKETLDIKKYIKEPIQDNLKILSNHFGRYYYAIKKMNINKDDIVLDIACGQGYGTYLLSQKAKYVYGMDANKEFISFAKKNLTLKNNSFLSVQKKYEIKVNKIVCIETIEHLEKNDIEPFIENLECKEIFITFPVGENKPSEYNTFHKCEPSIEFVYNIVKKYFNKIEIEIDKYVNNYGHLTEYCIMVGKA